MASYDLASVTSDHDTLLLVLSITSASLFWISVRQPPSLFRTSVKTASTALLALLTRHADSPLLPLALTLGAAGDAFLACGDSDTFFLGGLASFLSAHIVYIRLFLSIGEEGKVQIASETWRLSLALAMGLVAPGMNVLLMPRVDRKLRAPVLVYSAAILVMFLSVLTVERTAVVMGALLFTTSDVLLASDRFLVAPDSAHRVWMQYAVWPLYYAGQLLIALGLMGEAL